MSPPADDVGDRVPTACMVLQRIKQKLSGRFFASYADILLVFESEQLLFMASSSRVYVRLLLADDSKAGPSK